MSDAVHPNHQRPNCLSIFKREFRESQSKLCNALRSFTDDIISYLRADDVLPIDISSRAISFGPRDHTELLLEYVTSQSGDPKLLSSWKGAIQKHQQLRYLLVGSFSEQTASVRSALIPFARLHTA